MDLTVMHINKGNAHGTQGERSNPANSQHTRLLAAFIFYILEEFYLVISRPILRLFKVALSHFKVALSCLMSP